MRVPPYIGIAGFTAPEQVQYIIDALPDAPSRAFMVGVQVSHETLLSRPQPEFGRRRPAADAIGGIFPDDPRTLNYVHYNTGDHATLAGQLEQVTELAGQKLDGFQLNLKWPDPGALETYRTRFPDKGFVLQIGYAALAEIGNSPDALCRRLKADYEGLVDTILLDSGEGHGHPLDTESFRVYLRALKAHRLDIGPGVAGGIAADTMYLVQPLVREFDALSFDSEAPFFDADDRMDLDAARAYLLTGLALFETRSAGPCPWSDSER